MRKCICRLRLNEVSRQWGRRPEPPPSASCSCISCSPTGCPPRGEVGRRPASGRSSRQGMSPPHGCGGRSHGSAARSRCWYGCGSNARWENRSRSAFPLYNFLGHSLLSPFRMVCGNFILTEPACYVFFYAIFNLRNLLYIIFVRAPCPCFRRCYDYSPLPAKHVYFWANTSLRRSHRRQMVVI